MTALLEAAPAKSPTPHRFGTETFPTPPTEAPNLFGLALLPVQPLEGVVAGLTTATEIFSKITPPATIPFPGLEPLVLLTPTPEDRLHAELQSYLELPQGWDGYEGSPPTIGAVLDAFAFLACRPAGIPLPRPQISPDGEVGLYWHSGSIHAEVGFYGDGVFSFYASETGADGSVEEYLRDNCTLEGREWPEGLVRILNRLEP